MGSLMRDDIFTREKECTRNFLEHKLSNSKLAEQDIDVENKLFRDQLAKKDSELLKKLNRSGEDRRGNERDLFRRTRAFPKKVHSIPGDFNLTLEDRFKFLSKTLEDLKSGKSRMETKVDKRIPQLDANFPSGSAQLKERFTSLNYNLTKDIPEDFKIFIDCNQFRSNELTVIVKGGCVFVQGIHDVKFDEHGLIKREFTRRWSIPDDVKQDQFSCLLDRYGILTIRAPRKVSSITLPVQTEES